jgi:hypothetical protein
MWHNYNFTPTPVDSTTLKVLFQMNPVIVVVARPLWMLLVLKMVTPQQRSWCFLELAKKESVTAERRVLHTISLGWVVLCETVCENMFFLVFFKYVFCSIAND